MKNKRQPIKQEFNATVKWLDSNKYRIFNEGNIRFILSAQYPNGDTVCAGMGEGEYMCMCALEQTYNLFLSTQGKVPLEKFADSVRERFIAYAAMREKGSADGTVEVFPPRGTE